MAAYTMLGSDGAKTMSWKDGSCDRPGGMVEVRTLALLCTAVCPERGASPVPATEAPTASPEPIHCRAGDPDRDADGEPDDCDPCPDRGWTMDGCMRGGCPEYDVLAPCRFPQGGAVHFVGRTIKLPSAERLRVERLAAEIQAVYATSDFSIEKTLGPLPDINNAAAPSSDIFVISVWMDDLSAIAGFCKSLRITVAARLRSLWSKTSESIVTARLTFVKEPPFFGLLTLR